MLRGPEQLYLECLAAPRAAGLPRGLQPPKGWQPSPGTAEETWPRRADPCPGGLTPARVPGQRCSSPVLHSSDSEPELHRRHLKQSPYKHLPKKLTSWEMAIRTC